MRLQKRSLKKFEGNEVKYCEFVMSIEQLCDPFKNGNKNIGPVMQLCWPSLLQSLFCVCSDIITKSKSKTKSYPND